MMSYCNLGKEYSALFIREDVYLMEIIIDFQHDLFYLLLIREDVYLMKIIDFQHDLFYPIIAKKIFISWKLSIFSMIYFIQ